MLLPPFILSVGSPYPFSVPMVEGAVIDFLGGMGNCVLIAMPDLSAVESETLRFGKVEAGFLAAQGAILLLWKFTHPTIASATLYFETPFDARKIPEISHHHITRIEERLAINFHIVDSQSNSIKGLRLITFPHQLTVTFLSAVQDQFVSLKTGNEQLSRWRNIPIGQLLKTTQTRELGT